MPNLFQEYYRCPDCFSQFPPPDEVSVDEGYFRFHQAICFGRSRNHNPVSRDVTGILPDVSQDVEYDGCNVRLTFDLSEIVANLRHERYSQTQHDHLERMTAGGAARNAYYFVRPLLPVGIRKHLQRLRLRGWEDIPFPRWPVDLSVDMLMEQAMALTMKGHRAGKVPFVWFWPDGFSSCAVMTHDVEGPGGLNFRSRLMDWDESFGIKSSFQFIPELRYELSHAICDSVRERGFEANIHDLNHDGRLFQDREQFRLRAAQINKYVHEFGVLGFRSGAMYRRQDWYGDLDVSYDMSVPNVAHLEPQRGGCCTVMPFFVGAIVELPLTTIQDYSLFHILGDYSIELWKRQIELIRARHGLISFNTHPDYLVVARGRNVYLDLLAHLRRLRAESNVWVALPGDVDRWWRNRRNLSLVQEGESWRVQGPDSARARVAFARMEGDRLVYELERGSVLSQPPAASTARTEQRA